MRLGVGGVGEVGGEREPLGSEAVAEKFVEAGFVEGCETLVQVGHLLGVDVDAHHGVAHRRERGGVYCAKIAAAYNGDFHAGSPLLEVTEMVAGFAA